jgi:hypothetical protein
MDPDRGENLTRIAPIIANLAGQVPFALIRGIRVSPFLSVFIRVHPWLNCPGYFYV